jgi:hypothetical protein
VQNLRIDSNIMDTEWVSRRLQNGYLGDHRFLISPLIMTALALLNYRTGPGIRKVTCFPVGIVCCPGHVTSLSYYSFSGLF